MEIYYIQKHQVFFLFLVCFRHLWISVVIKEMGLERRECGGRLQEGVSTHQLSTQYTTPPPHLPLLDPLLASCVLQGCLFLLHGSCPGGSLSVLIGVNLTVSWAGVLICSYSDHSLSIPRSPMQYPALPAPASQRVPEGPGSPGKRCWWALSLPVSSSQKHSFSRS